MPRIRLYSHRNNNLIDTLPLWVQFVYKTYYNIRITRTEPNANITKLKETKKNVLNTIFERGGIWFPFLFNFSLLSSLYCRSFGFCFSTDFFYEKSSIYTAFTSTNKSPHFSCSLSVCLCCVILRGLNIMFLPKCVTSIQHELNTSFLRYYFELQFI